MKQLLFASLILSIFLTPLFSSETDNKYAIGLGYPYLSFKYNLNPKIALEVRGAFDTGINVFGGRFYYNFIKENKLSLFTGGELDYTSFNVEDTKGSGIVLLPFIGGEYPLNNKYSISFDFGPSYINLLDSSDSSISIEGIEWVINIGIWFRL